MDYRKDREYLITVKTEYKLLEKKYFEAKEELAKWNARINLAKEKTNTNLQTKAEKQSEIILNYITYLTGQLMELKIEVEKAALTIQESPRHLSINPGKLLTDINSLIGDKNSLNLEKEINKINVDNELEKLKRKMKQ